jgi:hypothetical protein
VKLQRNVGSVLALDQANAWGDLPHGQAKIFEELSRMLLSGVAGPLRAVVRII